jgi:antitoxin HigA-1
MTIKKPEKGWDIKRITTHPGVILRDDFLEPMGISAHYLAIKTRVPATRVSEIIHGRRSVTSDTALRLSQFFGTSAEFWMNLQAAYDLSSARDKSGDAIRREVQPLESEAVGA